MIKNPKETQPEESKSSFEELSHEILGYHSINSNCSFDLKESKEETKNLEKKEEPSLSNVEINTLADTPKIKQEANIQTPKPAGLKPRGGFGSFKRGRNTR